MAARKEVVETTIWLDKRTSDDDPSILEGDWRDKSISIRIQGARMQSGDPAWRGHEAGTAVEPDWSKGCWLETSDVHQTKLIEFGGYPGKIFADALLNGLVAQGIVCFQDDQRHGK